MNDLSWIAQRILCPEDWACVMSIEAHFDESGTREEETTVGGYLFEASRIDEFYERWLAELKIYNLPFLHMVDFAPGNPPFDSMNLDERIRLQMKLMRLLKRFSVNGIVCNVPNDGNENAYVLAAQKAVFAISEWAETTAYNGRAVSYTHLTLPTKRIV